MYLSLEESATLAKKISTISFDVAAITAAVFPDSLALTRVKDALTGSSVSLGAQNVAWVPQGAYTGALSALLFREAGASYALVGHSERRHIFGESDPDIRKKMQACFDVGLAPVLCIGETAEDLDRGKRQYRLKKQLMTALQGMDLSDKSWFIAYEPVWAIGTGKPCLPADVDDVHGWIREEVRQYASANVPLLYGGSVNAENIVSYTSRSCVDGVLVGGASTTYDSFLSLVHAIGASLA